MYGKAYWIYFELFVLQEELEVLQSIYDGDVNFKQTSETTFQYKVLFCAKVLTIYSEKSHGVTIWFYL